MNKHYRHLLQAIALAFFGTLKSYACSCMGVTVKENFKYSDAVFSGRVISRTLTSDYTKLGVIITGDTSENYLRRNNYPTAVIKIKVDKMYKGKSTSKILTVLTPPNEAACGYFFKVGKKYIIYATIFDEMLSTGNLKRRTFDNSTFWTHLCTRTNKWDSTEEKEILKVKI